MARLEEYPKQAEACRKASAKANDAKNVEERQRQLRMAEEWETLGRQRSVHKQLERVLDEVLKPDTQNRDAAPKRLAQRHSASASAERGERA